MKNIFRTAAVAIAAITISMSAAAQAQKGDMYLGGNLALGLSKSVTSFGIGAKFQYSVTDHLRLAGSSTYFLPKGSGAAKWGMWDVISADAHWLIPLAGQGKLSIYPQAGLGVMNYSSGNYSATKFGVNFGGGLDYAVSRNVILNGEMKYLIRGKVNRVVMSAGVSFKL